MLAAVARHHSSTGSAARRTRIGRSSQPARTSSASGRRYGVAMPLILLVEDDVAVSGALSRALTDAGHVVRPVGNAGSALRVIATDPPDLVILDLGLPDMDGPDVLRMLRGISNVPVIVATARRRSGDIVRLLNAGADDYVTKPFSRRSMSARIAAVLRRGQGTPGPAAVPAR